jgi:hypothetical protein
MYTPFLHPNIGASAQGGLMEVGDFQGNWSGSFCTNCGTSVVAIMLGQPFTLRMTGFAHANADNQQEPGAFADTLGNTALLRVLDSATGEYVAIFAVPEPASIPLTAMGVVFNILLLWRIRTVGDTRP